MRSLVAVPGLVGGLMFTLMLAWSLNPETPVQLRFENQSAGTATVHYDGEGPLEVPPGDEWALDSDDNGTHVLDLTASRAPVSFRLNFTSAPWNAKSFSLQLDIIEAN
jgi:hypothetical protein